MSDWILSGAESPAYFFQKRRFIRGKKTSPDDYQVPDYWAVQEGESSCGIQLTSFVEEVPDFFSLSDVRQAADAIIRKCASDSKEGLGGITMLGRLKGFYVDVNGAAPKNGLNSTAVLANFDPEAMALSRIRNVQID